MERFANAVYSEDWPTVWETLCRSTRDSHGTFSAFQQKQEGALQQAGIPSDVTVHATGVRTVQGADGATFLVQVLMTSESAGDVQEGEFPAVREEGHFRVCLS